MDKKVLNFLKDTFVFSGIAEESIEKLLNNNELTVQHFQKSDVIYSPEKFGQMLGFVMKGECEVSRRDGETVLPLNTLSKNDSFGALAVFSGKDTYPTYVIAKKSCEILFISKNSLDIILSTSPEATRNVIAFLAKKIAFLNEKIATFSQGSVTSKLAKYLLIELKAKNVTKLNLNCKKIAESLNVGRASIYRALDSLIECGCVISDKKELIVLDFEKLERI